MTSKSEQYRGFDIEVSSTAGDGAHRWLSNLAVRPSSDQARPKGFELDGSGCQSCFFVSSEAAIDQALVDAKEHVDQLLKQQTQ